MPMLSTPPPRYLAFDLGASSSRAVLGTLAGGRMQMEELCRFPTPLLEEGERLYWNLGALWNELQQGLRLALDAAPDLRSLSVDSWGVDYVPLGAEGEPLRNPHSYRDPRTEGRMEQAFARVSKETIYQTTGIQFLPFNTLYQVLADQETEPDVVARTRQRLLMADYFNCRFGGRPVVDRSMASTTQLLDAQTQQWAAGLMRTFDIDPDTWPEIVPCGTRIGTADLEASTIEIVASCSHDTAAAVAAAPARAGDDWAYISCGTWSLLGVERSAPLLTGAAQAAGFTNERGLGGTVRFLKNLAGLWPLQECVRVWKENGVAVSYDALTAEAAAAPPGLARLDLDDDRFVRRGPMPQYVRGYCRETGQPVPETRGQVARIILESLAGSYGEALDVLEALTGRAIDTVHLIGGGTQSELLCQLAADAVGRAVVAGPAEATALGNLLVQAQAMGDLPAGRTVRAAARDSATLTTYHPQQAHA